MNTLIPFLPFLLFTVSGALLLGIGLARLQMRWFLLVQISRGRPAWDILRDTYEAAGGNFSDIRPIP